MEMLHFFSKKKLPLFHPQCLNNHGGNNERNAQPERPVELLQFIKDNGGESDAVNRLQVVNKVYRESRNPTKSMQLQKEGQNRKNRA